MFVRSYGRKRPSHDQDHLPFKGRPRSSYMFFHNPYISSSSIILHHHPYPAPTAYEYEYPYRTIFYCFLVPARCSYVSPRSLDWLHLATNVLDCPTFCNEPTLSSYVSDLPNVRAGYRTSTGRVFCFLYSYESSNPQRGLPATPRPVGPRLAAADGGRAAGRPPRIALPYSYEYSTRSCYSYG